MVTPRGVKPGGPALPAGQSVTSQYKPMIQLIQLHNIQQTIMNLHSACNTLMGLNSSNKANCSNLAIIFIIYAGGLMPSNQIEWGSTLECVKYCISNLFSLLFLQNISLIFYIYYH